MKRGTIFEENNEINVNPKNHVQNTELMLSKYININNTPTKTKGKFNLHVDFHASLCFFFVVFFSFVERLQLNTHNTNNAK